MTRRYLEPLALIEKKRRSRNRKVIVIGILLAIILAGSVSATRIAAIRVNQVVVQGTENVPADEVRKYVENRLKGSYLGIIPKNNTLLISKHDMSAEILSSFTRLQDAHVSRLSTTGVVISAKERKPHFLFCMATPEGNMPEQCFFVDDQGYIFDRAPYFSGSAYFKFYNPTLVQEDVVTGRVLDAASFQDAITIINGLQKTLLVPISFTVASETEYVVTVRKFANGQTEPPLIYIRRDMSADTVVANIKAALASPEFAERLKKRKAVLQYLDLRYDDHVYFKWNDEPTTKPAEPKSPEPAAASGTTG